MILADSASPMPGSFLSSALVALLTSTGCTARSAAASFFATDISPCAELAWPATGGGDTAKACASDAARHSNMPARTGAVRRCFIEQRPLQVPEPCSAAWALEPISPADVQPLGCVGPNYPDSTGTVLRFLKLCYWTFVS